MIFQHRLLESLQNNKLNIAIESGNIKITYAELWHTANQITEFLLNNQLEREQPVGLVMDDRAMMITAMVGILYARGNFVPIDVSLPDNRLEAVIKELDLKHVLSTKTQKNIEKVNKYDFLNITFLEDLFTENKDQEPHPLDYPEFDKDDSIYVYFTSGSTGKPKGIIGRNCSLLQFVDWEIKTFEIDSDARFSQFISTYFDAFLRDVFVPLIAGGTICIPPSDKDFFSEEKMIAWIDESQVSLIHCVPSLFQVMNSNRLIGTNFKNLKHILLSGERIVPSDLINWYTVFNDRIQLVNLYGTTETTMIRSFYKIQPQDAKQAKISIGKPIADTELLITKGNFKPCNTLIVGDLYIVSKFVSKGYLNRPDLNHEKFIALHAGTEKETIAFKTGDKARKLPNGNIDLIGRADRQVKLRGIRIELNEIENVANQCEFVKNAVVLKQVDENKNEYLTAFLIKQDLDTTFDLTAEVEAFLKNNLPAYMIPSNLVELEKLPLLSNGKINYKELENYQADESKEIKLPTNEIESQLLQVWREILGDKPISIDDRFNKIGGSSLSIMRLIGRIYKEFSVRVTLNDLFNNLTIEKQASHIQGLKTDDALLIPKAAEKSAYRLSAAQERMYYNYELDKFGVSYNLPMAWKINGEFDNDKAKVTLKSLIERHESLRTAFKLQDGEIFQVLDENAIIEIEYIDGKGEKIAESVANFIRPFDLSRAPLIRCGIIITPEEEKIFITDIHHIICDGLSQMNLFSDFVKLYNGENLPILNIQYKDYAEWEKTFTTTNDYLSQREFWLNSFEGDLPKLELPTNRSETEQTSNEGGQVPIEINTEALNKLLNVFDEYDVSAFSGFFSIFFCYLNQLTGQEDIVIGTASSGRMQHELEELVGMFMKTLPIRQKVDSNLTFKDFTKQTHQFLLQAMNQQTYDLVDIVRDLNKGRTNPVNQLFEVLFVFQNFDEKRVGKNKNLFSHYEIENRESPYPLSLIIDRGDSFEFYFEYALSYFTQSDTEMLAERFSSLINNISKNLNSRLIDFFENASSSGLIEDDVIFNF